MTVSIRSAPFVRAVDLSLELHVCDLRGADDDDATERVREEADLVWDQLNDDERAAIRGLAVDFNWTLGRGLPSARGVPLDPNGAVRMASLAQEERWLEYLQMLREILPSLPPHHTSGLALLRSTAWHELGFTRVALRFTQFAREADPQSEEARRRHLVFLAEVDPKEAEALSWEAVRNFPLHPPTEVIEAASQLATTFDSRESNEDAMAAWGLLAGALSHAVTICEQRRDPSDELGVAAGHYVLGHAFRRLEDIDAARVHYDFALRICPDRADWLVGRGTLLYPIDPPAAVDDLERANLLGYTIALAQLYLAHHYLLAGRWDDCLRASSRGIQLSSSNQLRAALYEFSAIALFETGASSAEALRTFEIARLLDPENDRIVENLARFLALVDTGRASPSDRRALHLSALAKLKTQILGPLDAEYALSRHETRAKAAYARLAPAA